MWWRTSHDAGTHGTTLLQRMLGRRKAFPFPKSLYAVRDCLEAVVRNRPNALIIDFFAGSGTTLHATALLNRDDGGSRRCILVTNNEVAKKTAARLHADGFFQGDPEFEAEGVYESATKPRVEAALTGIRPSDGKPFPKNKNHQYLDGTYWADGFEENVQFFRIDYLDPDRVELGMEYEALKPLLWLIAGAHGPEPSRPNGDGSFMVNDAARYGVLLDVLAFPEFVSAVSDKPDVRHLFLLTEDQDAFADMTTQLGPGRETHMLPREHLTKLRINTPASL